MCRLSRNSGDSTSWNTKGLSRPVAGKLYLTSNEQYSLACCNNHSGGYDSYHPVEVSADVPSCWKQHEPMACSLGYIYFDKNWKYMYYSWYCLSYSVAFSVSSDHIQNPFRSIPNAYNCTESFLIYFRRCKREQKPFRSILNARCRYKLVPDAFKMFKYVPNIFRCVS